MEKMCLIGLLWCLLTSIIYLSSVYFTGNSRGDRNSTNVIKSRLQNVMASTVIDSTLVVALYLRSGYSFTDTLNLLGLTHLQVKSIALTPLLYLGYISQVILTHSLLSDSLDIFFLRNFIIAPITEEVCYRLCIVSLLRLYTHPHSNISIVLFSPFFFGLSHVHHGVVSYLQHKSLSKSILTTSFQFAYTSLFGSFAAFVYLRTGSIYPCIISHSLCNFLGLPMINEITHLDSKLSKTIISSIYLIGIFLFMYLLWPLTSSTNSFWIQ